MTKTGVILLKVWIMGNTIPYPPAMLGRNYEVSVIPMVGESTLQNKINYVLI